MIAAMLNVRTLVSLRLLWKVLVLLRVLCTVGGTPSRLMKQLILGWSAPNRQAPPLLATLRRRPLVVETVVENL